MFIYKFITILIFCLTGFGNAGFISNGPCPSNITGKSNFNLNHFYIGIWYEYSKYGQVNGKCASVEYTPLNDGRIRVKNTEMDSSTGEYYNTIGYVEPFENGTLKVTYPLFSTFNEPSNLLILDTDYNTFSVVYSCQPISSNMHLSMVWILTRIRMAPQEADFAAELVLLEKGISLGPLKQTDQLNCGSCEWKV